MTADQKYEAAMAVSDDLLQRMQEHSHSSDAVRAMMADIWAQRHNVPFTTTVYESIKEMTSATRHVDEREP